MKKITLLAVLFSAVTMNAQIFSENFDGDTADTNEFAQFTAIDVDDDGENWEVADILGEDIETETSMSLNVADSDSWEGAPFMPDQYLVSNELLNLTGATGNLTFTMGTYQTNGTFLEDRLAIYLSTSNDPAVIEGETPVFDMTVADVTTAVDAATAAVDLTVDISAMIGQQVYLVFRHFDTNDHNSVLVDNVVIEGSLGLDDVAFDSFSYFVDANNNLNISSVNNFSNITLTNMIGQQVISRSLSTTNEVINMDALNTGIYIATVSIDGATKTFKVSRK